MCVCTCMCTGECGAQVCWFCIVIVGVLIQWRLSACVSLHVQVWAASVVFHCKVV